MDTGTRTGIVYTADDGSDGTDSFRHSIRNLAAWAEAQGAEYLQDVLASRPAAGKGGRFFKDTGVLGDGVVYYDNGTTWESVGTVPATDAAAGVGSLRTLGAGSLQAAAGNHTHSSTLSTLFVQKPADTTRTSTTTLADDPHLVLTLAASGTYVIKAPITYRATATPKLKMNFRIGTGVTFKAWSAVGVNSTGTFSAGTNVSAGNNPVAANDFVTYSGIGNMGGDWVFTHDIIVTTAGTGTYAFAFQWAQNTSDAGASTVTLGSYLLATKIV